MKRLVFIAFGDSLTVGTHSSTVDDPSPTLYTRALQSRMENESGFRVEFVNRGVSGEVTEEMLARFEVDVIDAHPDVVIVLGGSNDLGWGIEPSEILGNLIGMYDRAQERGIRPVACTVPSVLGWDEGIKPRLELNRLIREHCERSSIVCVDVFSATCDADMRLKQEYSDDGLHLTPLGYRAMADAVFSDAVKAIVEASLRQG
jgi:alpha-L-fucosidase